MSEEVPESRSYVHTKCGEATEVDGGDFKNMASPVPGMITTVCSNCGGTFPVEEFQWEDTGEGIADYYERYRVRVPALVRWVCSRQVSIACLLMSFLLGIALGIWVWNAKGAVWGVAVGVVASLAGAIAGLVTWDAVSARILSRSLNVPDVRCLK